MLPCLLGIALAAAAHCCSRSAFAAQVPASKTAHLRAANVNCFPCHAAAAAAAATAALLLTVVLLWLLLLLLPRPALLSPCATAYVHRALLTPQNAEHQQL
jgi:hypothetical protein